MAKISTGTLLSFLAQNPQTKTLVFSFSRLMSRNVDLPFLSCLCNDRFLPKHPRRSDQCAQRKKCRENNAHCKQAQQNILFTKKNSFFAEQHCETKYPSPEQNCRLKSRVTGRTYVPKPGCGCDSSF